MGTAPDSRSQPSSALEKTLYLIDGHRKEAVALIDNRGGRVSNGLAAAAMIAYSMEGDSKYRTLV